MVKFTQLTGSPGPRQRIFEKSKRTEALKPAYALSFSGMSGRSFFACFPPTRSAVAATPKTSIKQNCCFITLQTTNRRPLPSAGRDPAALKACFEAKQIILSLCLLLVTSFLLFPRLLCLCYPFRSWLWAWLAKRISNIFALFKALLAHFTN